MTTFRMTVMAIAAAAMMNGCASGGAGDEASQDGWGASGAEVAGGLQAFFCGLAGGSPHGDCPTPESGPQVNLFTDWQSVSSGTPVFADGVDVGVSVYRYMGVTQGVSQAWAMGLQAELTFSETRSIRAFTARIWPSASGIGYFSPDGSGAGFAAGRGIETLWRTTTEWNESPSSTMFTSTPGTVALVANPYASGWNYQSFGVWASRQDDGTDRASGMSFGSATTAIPGGAVPTTGSATFTGTLAGLYVNGSGVGSVAAADLRVDANFSERSLGISSSNTVTTRAPSTTAQVMAAPHLNLSGTLRYAPGSGAFSGGIATAGGAMSGTSNGQFYGPAAQELGGVFALKSPTTVETFVGAYGAKR